MYERKMLDNDLHSQFVLGINQFPNFAFARIYTIVGRVKN